MYTADLADPVRTPMAAADGDKAWYGWPDFPQVEALRDQYALSSDPAEQKRIAAELQRVAIDEGLYVPLGQSTPLRAYSSKLSGLPLAPARCSGGRQDPCARATVSRTRPAPARRPIPFSSLEAACVGYWQ